MWTLNGSKRAIVIAGCLGMAYTQLTLSPATIDFARSMGGGSLHVGILTALPFTLLFMQLLSAVMAQRLRGRKRIWFCLSLVQRLIFLPVALGPWLYPDVDSQVWLWALLATSALNQGLLHFCTPLWMSWMGDLLPHEGLSRFWGRRHRWTQWTAAAALFLVACLFLVDSAASRGSFAFLTTLAVSLGVCDILLFVRVPEPAAESHDSPRLWDVLAEPFRRADFRSFILFSSFWNLAAMVGAPFISLFLLAHVGMSLFQVLLLWTLSWVGGSMFSETFGRLVDRHGQRPVLILCTAFKSSLMAVMLVVPRDPVVTFWILVPAFMFDALLNSGITIANNGFLLKNSPSRNRTMFIAAGTAFAGMIGGITSIISGWGLEATSDWTWSLGSWHLVNYHLAFGASLVLRMAAGVVALSLKEAGSHGTRHVVTELVATYARIGLAIPRRPEWNQASQPAVIEGEMAA